MATLCDDVISVVLDNIHPPLFTDIFNQVIEEYTTHVQPTKNDIERVEEAYYDEYDNLWPATYYLNTTPHVLENRGIYMALGKLKEIRTVYGHTKLDYFNTIYQLLEMYKTHSMFHKSINNRLNYDYKLVMKILMAGFKDNHKRKTMGLFNDINRLSTDTWRYTKKVMKYPTRCDDFIFTNRGCLYCNKYLPHWWPVAGLCDTWDVYMPHINKSVLDTWIKKTDGYVSEGCCSFRCYINICPEIGIIYDKKYGYISYNKRKLQKGDKIKLMCKYEECCNNIKITDAIINGTYYCDNFCRSQQSYIEFKEQSRSKRRRGDW